MHDPDAQSSYDYIVSDKACVRDLLATLTKEVGHEYVIYSSPSRSLDTRFPPEAPLMATSGTGPILAYFVRQVQAKIKIRVL